jgi:hypothetical protein
MAAAAVVVDMAGAVVTEPEMATVAVMVAVLAVVTINQTGMVPLGPTPIWMTTSLSSRMR